MRAFLIHKVLPRFLREMRSAGKFQPAFEPGNLLSCIEYPGYFGLGLIIQMGVRADYEVKRFFWQQAAHQHAHDFAFNDDYTKLFTVHHGRIQAWELKAPGPAEAEIPA